MPQRKRLMDLDLKVRFNKSSLQEMLNYDLDVDDFDEIFSRIQDLLFDSKESAYKGGEDARKTVV